MKQIRVLASCSLLILTLAMHSFADDRYIVRVHPSIVDSVSSQYGFRVEQQLKSGEGLYLVSVRRAASNTAFDTIKSNPLVQSVESNTPVVLPELSSSFQRSGHKVPVLNGGAPSLAIPGWVAYLNQPANGIVRVADAQRRYGFGNGGVVVAVIDTGVDFTHPALAGVVNFWQGWDFIRGVPDGSGSTDLNQETTPFVDQETTPFVDGSGTIVLNQETTPFVDQETTPFVDNHLPAAFGHGTMVAGIIHLVAPNVRIMPLKAFSSDGSGTMANVIAAIYYAVDKGADVINMSFSAPQSSKELQTAIQYAVDHNVICVAAVSNDGSPALVYPAALNKVIGIASTNNQDVRSTFSNFGSDVEVAAPGEGVISTFPRNRYAAGWGTSFSTPYVAGAVALLRSLNRYECATEAAKDLGAGAANVRSYGLGAGRLDVYQTAKGAN